jgi:peptidoglycan-N-acetylglucosamine deacetylase
MIHVSESCKLMAKSRVKILNPIRQVTKALLQAMLPSQQLLVRGRVPSFAVDSPNATIRISLTFDDGPHVEYTPRLLDYLAALGCRATFFVIGKHAEQFPQIIQRIVGEGHELGNHTYTHSEPSETSNEKFLEEIDRTRLLLQDLTGDDCSLVRPPKGKLTFGKITGLWRRQLTPVLWTVDPWDFAMSTRREMEQWCGNFQPSNGDIVLLHDTYPQASTFVERFPDCPDFDDVRFVPVSDWLASPTVRRAKQTA